jgi:CheY-like chemotaxis protein
MATAGICEREGEGMKQSTILIVDDSPTSRFIIKRCFEIAGFPDASYLFAGDGVEALQILDEHEVDVLVTDLNMPKCGGADLLDRIIKAGRCGNMKVVVVSSVAEAVPNGSRQLVSGIIKKPVSPQKIAAVLGGESCTT